MIELRELDRCELGRVREIDRTELIEAIYYLEEGALVLKPERYDMRGWPPGTLDQTEAALLDCHDRGGWCAGAFDGDRLVGIVALESRSIGAERDQLQLLILHVSNGYRDQGVGARLFEAARAVARQWGARHLYVSATPSEHTITFYLGRGCQLHSDPDPELWAEEPEDIHLLCDVNAWGHGSATLG
jgi:GNAT superfamily N-acetyltransferase